MTTIVAKTQIALSWEEISDVESYEVFRNGVHMKTVQENRFIDRNFSLDEPYIYAVYSKRPLAESGKDLSKSKSVVTHVFDTVNRSSSVAKASWPSVAINATRSLLVLFWNEAIVKT